jgi:hypothetical protein
VTREEMGTRYGTVVIRVLVNPEDSRDMEQVHALQDHIKVEQKSSGTYEVPNFDPLSQKKVRDALLVLGMTLPDTKRMSAAAARSTRFGTSPEVRCFGAAFRALYLNVASQRRRRRCLQPHGFSITPILSTTLRPKPTRRPVAVQFGGCHGNSRKRIA